MNAHSSHLVGGALYDDLLCIGYAAVILQSTLNNAGQQSSHKPSEAHGLMLLMPNETFD